MLTLSVSLAVMTLPTPVAPASGYEVVLARFVEEPQWPFGYGSAVLEVTGGPRRPTVPVGTRLTLWCYECFPARSDTNNYLRMDPLKPGDELYLLVLHVAGKPVLVVDNPNTAWQDFGVALRALTVPLGREALHPPGTATALARAVSDVLTDGPAGRADVIRRYHDSPNEVLRQYAERLAAGVRR